MEGSGAAGGCPWGKLIANHGVDRVQELLTRLARRMFSTICPSAVAGLVALELCGVMVILGWLQKACSAGNGSFLNTSKTAWRKRPASSAAIRAFSTIKAPRPTLINAAARGHRPEIVNLSSSLWRS